MGVILYLSGILLKGCRIQPGLFPRIFHLLCPFFEGVRIIFWVFFPFRNHFAFWSWTWWLPGYVNLGSRSSLNGRLSGGDQANHFLILLLSIDMPGARLGVSKGVIMGHIFECRMHRGYPALWCSSRTDFQPLCVRYGQSANFSNGWFSLPLWL